MHEDKRIKELDEKINQLEARKIQMKNRLNEKKRKERTRRLIQVGAIFEKYFDIEGVEQAEQVALAVQEIVFKNKDKIENINLEQSKEQNRVVHNNQLEYQK